MTEYEFFREALLRIAGNSAFANDWDRDECSATQWAMRVEEAADALLDIAIGNKCLEPDYKDEPP